MTASTQAPALKRSPGLLGWLGVPIRLGLGALFLWASYMKIGPANGPQVFSGSINAYKLNLPEHLVVLATFGVPWTEALVGVTLILGVWTRASAAVVAGMLTMFIALGVSALNRGLSIKCGCFGDRTLLCEGGVSWCHVSQNAVFALLALIVVLWPRPALAIDRLAGRRCAA